MGKEIAITSIINPDGSRGFMLSPGDMHSTVETPLKAYTDESGRFTIERTGLKIHPFAQPLDRPVSLADIGLPGSYGDQLANNHLITRN